MFSASYRMVGPPLDKRCKRWHIRRVEVQLHSFLTLALDKSAVVRLTLRPRHSFNRNLGGPMSRYGHFRQEKNLLPVLRLGPPIVYPVD
jgi:hypothetical protein